MDVLNKTFLIASLFIIISLVAVMGFGGFGSSSFSDSVVGSAILSSGIISDGDAYIGENPNDPNWEWDLEGLLTFADHQLGVESDFVANDPTDNPAPLGVGDCYGLPDNYLRICFDGLTQHGGTGMYDPPSSYKDLVLEFTDSLDLTEAGFPHLTSEPAIYIHYPDSSRGLILQSANLDKITSDVRTDKVWLYHNTTLLEEVYVFYEDNHGDTTYAGKIRDIYHDFLKVERGLDLDGFQSRIGVSLNDYPSTNMLGVILAINGYRVYEDFNTKWKLSSQGKFASLGELRSWEEANELSWADGSMSLNIGTKDEDHRSKYGIIVRDPKSHGASDEVILNVPIFQVKAGITIYGPNGEYINDVIPLGLPIGSEDFGFVIDHTDLFDMQSGSITYRGHTSRIKDELHLVSGGPTIETSLTSAEDDYQQNVFIESEREAIKYYYRFLDGMDLTSATISDPIIINFLRDRLLIQGVVGDTQLNLGFCGDGICSAGETRLTCSSDCGGSPGGSPLKIKTTAI